MKIGFFTGLDAWGGSESYLKQLIVAVRASGHAVVLFGVGGTRIIDELRLEGVECVICRQGASRHDVSPLSQAKSPLNARSNLSSRHQLLRIIPAWVKLLAGNEREVRHLCRIFAAHPVDVMHIAVHGYEVAGIACRIHRIPCLAMNMMSPVAEEYWIRRLLMKYTMRAYDHVSSQSAYCTQAWINFAGLSPAKCSFVWSSADTNLFHPAHAKGERSAGDRFRIVSAARLHPMKGHKYVIEAIKLLNDPLIRLDIFGEGPEREELQRSIGSAYEAARFAHLRMIAEGDLPGPRLDDFYI